MFTFVVAGRPGNAPSRKDWGSPGCTRMGFERDCAYGFSSDTQGVRMQSRPMRVHNARNRYG
jgi:hypothetical protein